MCELTIVVPLFNEQNSVVSVCESIELALNGLNKSYEIILVDDGSRDETAKIVRRLADANVNIKAILFARNFGQTAALMAGFDHARGQVLVPMDGDGQNDPADIPALLAKLEEGYDVVSGWREQRQDPAFTRVLLSRLANKLISGIAGVRLHDYGCTLKAYRREILNDVRIYGEMHRYIPIFAFWQGARVTEMAVRHHPRRHDKSKYGLDRILKVLLDLIIIHFLDRYASKPIYVFGSFGLFSILASFLAGGVALWLKFFADISFISTPLPLVTVLLFIVGIMSVFMGVQAEILTRIYFEGQGKASYVVKETINVPQ
jgi:glycosyltransferase involved in cell wall biosynthesis